MPLSILRKWLNRGPARKGAARKKTPFRKCFLEVLEDRTLLSNYTVDLGGDAGVKDVTDPTGHSGDIRYCISQANIDPTVNNITFNLPAGTSAIQLTQGQLSISNSMNITGPGAGNLTIDGFDRFRVFDVTFAGANVNISGLTITRGDASPVSTSTGNQGGDILNNGNLTLTQDTISNGLAEGTVITDGRGGGIFNQQSATLTLVNTVVTGNSAISFNSTRGLGGGIYNDTGANLYLENGSQITYNHAYGSNGTYGGRNFNGYTGSNGHAGYGGGIYNKGVLTISGTSGQQISISNDTAKGGTGGNGGNGQTPGTAGAGGNGSTGGNGGGGGGGGKGEGGAIYNTATGTVKSFSNTIFTNDTAQGGDAGAAGLAGNGGAAGSAAANAPTIGGTGGAGGNGGFGGFAEGGAIINFGGLQAISQATFNTDVAQAGNASVAGAGGKGGAGSGGPTEATISPAGTGGVGGVGGQGMAGGNAFGGAIANELGTLIVSGQFTSNQAVGGNGGGGGAGGTGGVGGSSGNGGSGGQAKGAGVGGSAKGGGLYNTASAFTIGASTFTSNQANTGAGAAGGAGGTGGNSGAKANTTETGGTGGNGADGSDPGEGAGGAVYNEGGDLTVGNSLDPTSGSTFTSNVVNVAAGGDGGLAGTLVIAGNTYSGGNGVAFSFGPTARTGVGGNDGNGNGVDSAAAIGFGGAIGVTKSNVSVYFSTIGGVGAGNQVLAAAAGNGGPNTESIGLFGGHGGTGGTGTSIYGGGIAAYDLNGTKDLTLANDTLTGNILGGSNAGNGGEGNSIGGRSGNGGQGGEVWGGGVAYIVPATGSAASHTISITASPISVNQITAGNGGRPQPQAGRNGKGGDAAPDSGGGGVAISDPVGTLNTSLLAGVTAGVTIGSNVTTNTVTGGNGGDATTGSGSAVGGKGTNVHGGGIYTLNSGLTVTDSSVSNNVNTAGNGGKGAVGFNGGVAGGNGSNGGAGGSADGGGIFFNNNSGTPLNFSYTVAATSSGVTVSGNHLTAGTGGNGGDAGSSGVTHVLGGSGGTGGNADGGGISLQVSSGTNTSTVTNAEIDQNIVMAGAGGLGGQGSSNTVSPLVGLFARGGDGGNAAGGGLDSVLNGGGGGKLVISGSTMAGNKVTGGNGNQGGSGSAGNGGPGGSGGNGGNAQGGGFWDDDNTLTVNNSTVGGAGIGNVLTAGSGGAGSNGNDPGLGGPKNNGGDGGNGGFVQGGGIYFNKGTALFTNDTITNNDASNFGAGGNPGGGTSAGGLPGKTGTSGAIPSGGGGIFNDIAGTSQPGNTIIALNTASTGPDVDGNFGSRGNNILDSTSGGTGFVASDITNSTPGMVTAATLNLGPLLNNGGPTMTSALLSGSIALQAGNPGLDGGIPYDQRGADFLRTILGKVDVGAFEYQVPTIDTPDSSGLHPDTAVAGSPAFLLTITGTAFETGATVYFGGDILTPLTISSTTITVTVPSADIATAGPVNVLVENPDGSGSGGTVDSNADTFTVTPQPALTLTYTDGNQTSDEGVTIAPLTVTSSIPSGNNFTVTGLPAGLTFSNAVLNDHLVISGTIGARAAGSYNITVNDTNGSQTASTIFTWTVNDTNPPTFTNPGNQNNTVGNKVSLATNPVDADAGSIAASNLPDGVSVDSTTGVISGTLAADAAGTYDIAITGSDGGVTNPPNSVTFVWTVSNLALTNPGPQTNIVGDTVNLSIQADNPDAGSFSATNLPIGLNIDPNSGVISGTIAANAAGNYATSVSDTQGGTINTVSFSWMVTTGQTLQNPGNQTSTVGVAITALQIQDTKGDAGSFTATNLPPGLSISTNGLITGTPTTTTGSPFSVTVNDKDNGTPASVTFTWTVTATSSTTLQNPGPQTNADGDPVNLAIQDKGADANSFKVTNLPPGLNINASTGAITGTISAGADSGSPYSVTVSDTEGGTPVTVAFTWTVTVAKPTFTNPGNQTNVVSDTVTSLATNPVNADAGTITAANLPTGLSINPNTGVISGTIAANAAGTYAVTVSATDKGVPGSISFTWTVNAPNAPTLTNPGNQSSIVGDTVNLTIPATGEDLGTFTTMNLPTGLSINGNTGVIAGTIAANAAGTYAVTVSARHMGVSGSVAFTWTVSNPSSPTFTNPGKQTNRVGDTINLTIPATNADPGTYKATNLPTGLSINPNTGLISGTIAGAAATYNTTISATDRGVLGSVSFSWVVGAGSGGGGGGGGGSGGSGGVGGATTVTIASIQNTYPLFLFQVETITANVVGPNGAPVNEGFVTFTVDGLMLHAPVQNGMASLTIVNPFLDFSILPELFFPHGLDAVYSDPNGIFGTSSSSFLEQAILLDFFFSLFNNPALFL